MPIDIQVAAVHRGALTLMARDLPSGTVTFLFTDVEGSTKLLHTLGDAGYASALAEHRTVVRAACAASGGVEVDTQGDAFLIAFPTAPGGLAAARQIRDAFEPGPIKVRMGVHTGTPLLTGEGYVGTDIHRAARIAAAGHGGQILVSAATVALVDGDDLRDLGEHRLKDLLAPERIHQLGDSDFPPLRSLYRTNLPIPISPFLGRDREVAEIIGLLIRQDVRVLTLTGPGGTGKTRLSMQAAASVGERYADGIWWVPLAPLRDPMLVTETVARVLGAGNSLAEHIGDRSMLLVLDNFEQLIEAAVELAGVLAVCPRLNVLATSRESLHIGGEHEYPVPPLAPDEGIELFLARAHASGADIVADAAVAEICRRLDGMPLAIELAAARVKALSPAQILARLDQRLSLLTGGARDLPERQRTLRGAIDWSHDLLTPDEQVVLRRLSVFRGGCTLDAAEAVAGADVDILGSLVDKSLLRHVEERFRMLETIRQYAAERLEAAGEGEAVHRLHAEHFLAFAEAAYPNLKGDPQGWLDRLEADHDNLRAAVDRFGTTGETQFALQLGGALWKFWYQRGHVPEGRRRLEAALAADASPTPARGRALNGASGLMGEYGDIDGARRYDEEALVLYRALGDVWGVANSIFMLGSNALLRRDHASARQLLGECIRSFRELGDDHYVLLATDALAATYEDLADRDLALPLHEATLQGARATGNRRMEVSALHSLAYWARLEGRTDDALSMVEAAYPINLDLGQRVETMGDLSRFARILADADRPLNAARLLAASLALGEELGVSRQYEVERDQETITILRARLSASALDEALEAGRTLSVEDAFALVRPAAPP